MKPELLTDLRAGGYDGELDVDSLYQECRRRKIFSSLVRIPPGTTANKGPEAKYTACAGVLSDSAEEALAELLLASLENRLDKQVS